MTSLAEILRAAASRELGELPEIPVALSVLGPDARLPVDQVPSQRRLLLTDQFVRNLRTVPMERAVDLTRSLLPAVGASVPATWRTRLDGPHAVIALRNQLKLMLTAAGLSWTAIARLQSCVCMLAGWLGESGGGQLELESTARGVRVRIHTPALNGDAALLADSPMVGTLRQHAPDVGARSEGAEIVLQFSITGAA